jgi:hypothetical protein
MSDPTPPPANPSLAKNTRVFLSNCSLEARIVAAVKDKAGNVVEYKVAGFYPNNKKFECFAAPDNLVEIPPDPPPPAPPAAPVDPNAGGANG